jgi:hypothetical protein
VRTPRKERLRNNAAVGKIVVLNRDAKTRGGNHFKKGQRMRVHGTWHGKFRLYALTPTGRESVRGIYGMRWSDFELEENDASSSNRDT